MRTLPAVLQLYREILSNRFIIIIIIIIIIICDFLK